MIPFYGCAREYNEHRWEYLKIIDEVLSSGQLLQGKPVEDFEGYLSRYVGRQECVAVGSCTDALYFALKAVGVREGDEIIVTSFSFAASASCIVRAGAIPVFVDIGPGYNMSAAMTEDAITKKTRAIVWVPLFGDMVGFDDILSICESYNLVLIEDAAQALGSEYQDKDYHQAGTIGDISCFSFDPTKPISALGSGGAVLTDNLYYAEKIREYRYHDTHNETPSLKGYNSQMSTTTAAILSAKLCMEQDWRKRRQEIAKRYIQEFKGIKDLECKMNMPSETGLRSNFHKFVIETTCRHELMKFLEQHGIETKVHYPYTLPQLYYGNGYYEDYPNAHQASARCLSLPIHPFLAEDEVTRVIESIKDFFGRQLFDKVT